ncbi:MAG: 30S ribosomal protein S4, partial [Candidatus Poribacteria bacterium]|nr:30S ribosomal protein S4 [Candidatus Poribacteria bacterium]
MIRSGEPKHKICRKAGYCLWNNSKCPASRGKQTPPGEHGRKSFRRSDYSRMLFEKQKLRYTYNVSEKQFRLTFDKAKQMRGVTAENLIGLLETRLDTIIFRAGYASSPFQARQLVGHGHFRLDGQKVDVPSIQVKPGQVISVRDKSKNHDWAQVGLDRLGETPAPYLEINRDTGQIRLAEVPAIEQVPIGG